MREYFLFILTVILITTSLPLPLHADRPKKAEDAQEAEDISQNKEVDLYAIPPILDPQYRHKKKNQLEFAPNGGFYLGSTVGQTWTAGFKTYFHMSNTLALGASFAYSRLLTDRSSSFGQSLVNTNMHVANVEVLLSTDTAMRVGKSLIELDLFTTLGVGPILINNNWEPCGQIGGGVKIYTGLTWLAFRIDINNYLHFTEKPGNDPFDVDIAFIGGPSILFPSRPSPYEQQKN